MVLQMKNGKGELPLESGSEFCSFWETNINSAGEASRVETGKGSKVWD
jgi:hypothetical protein